MMVIRVRVGSEHHQDMATKRKKIGCGEKFS